MKTRAEKSLTAGEIRKLLARLELAATREACWSCECLQELVSDLKLDAVEEAKSLLELYEVRPERMHGCLGCQPCPPAELFASRVRTS